MKTKKPDIFLGITLCLLVLAAVLCIVILFVQKNNKNPKPVDTGNTSISDKTNDTANSGNTGNSDTGNTGNTAETGNPVEPEIIDEAGLKEALDDSLRGLTSEWQVMVIDPATGSRVSSSANCEVEEWMTANRMAQVFIMGTVFQQGKDGILNLDDHLEDVKAMINANDTYAADRLTEAVGGGDAAKGRDAVKAFAVDNGVKLGFNRPLTGTDSKKNYVTAPQAAAVLELICQGKLVSEAYSRQMLDILLTPVEEPEIDPGLTGAVRSGFINDVEDKICACTMGVVELQNRSFIISVVCNKPVTANGAKSKITELISITEPFFAK